MRCSYFHEGTVLSKDTIFDLLCISLCFIFNGDPLKRLLKKINIQRNRWKTNEMKTAMKDLKEQRDAGTVYILNCLSTYWPTNDSTNVMAALSTHTRSWQIWWLGFVSSRHPVIGRRWDLPRNSEVKQAHWRGYDSRWTCENVRCLFLRRSMLLSP